MKKRALLTGINGQAASHLADLLLKKDYDVFGLERRASTKSRGNVKHIENKINFIVGDLTDQNSILRAIKASDPDEIYGLAAQSFVGESWNTPEQTGDVTGLGALRILEAIREHNKKIKFLHASSSEQFGKMTTVIADENTCFYPRSPYGVAKLYAHWITKNYRESYEMYTCNAICFNYEGTRRGHEFVTRKITDGVAKIHLGKADKIRLGNIEALRDWGAAEDTVRAMWLMMQELLPDDYVVATGEVHSVKDFLKVAFECVGIKNWQDYVVYDEKFLRPAEVDYLKGDSTKLRTATGWKPEISFEQMIKNMVENDIKLLS